MSRSQEHASPRRGPPRRAPLVEHLSLAIGALVVAAALGGCGGEAPPPPAPPPQDNSASVPWVPVRRSEGVALLSVPARVVPEARSQAVIALPSAARVVGVRANPGDVVEQGAPIAEVVLPDLAEAAGRLVAARTRQAAYRRVLEQLDELDKHGLARLQDRADAEVKLAEAEAEEQSALAALAAAGVSPREAERLASSGGRMVLESPLAGRLAESRAVLGARLSPEEGPLARIAATASTRVEARVPLEVASLEGGAFAPSVGEARRATREGCLPEVEPDDGTLRCWFSVEGEPLPSHLPGLLRLDAPADVRLLAVPRASVGLDAVGSYVVRRTPEGGQQLVRVRVLATAGGDALVDGPLEEGDRVAARAPRLEEEPG